MNLLWAGFCRPFFCLSPFYYPSPVPPTPRKNTRRRMFLQSYRATMNLTQDGSKPNKKKWTRGFPMPEQRLVTTSLMLVFSLALAGCNSGSDSHAVDDGANGGGQSGALLEPGENEALLYYK